MSKDDVHGESGSEIGEESFTLNFIESLRADDLKTGQTNNHYIERNSLNSGRALLCEYDKALTGSLEGFEE